MSDIFIVGVLIDCVFSIMLLVVFITNDRLSEAHKYLIPFAGVAGLLALDSILVAASAPVAIRYLFILLCAYLKFDAAGRWFRRAFTLWDLIAITITSTAVVLRAVLVCFGVECSVLSITCIVGTLCIEVLFIVEMASAGSVPSRILIVLATGLLLGSLSRVIPAGSSMAISVVGDFLACLGLTWAHYDRLGYELEIANLIRRASLNIASNNYSGAVAALETIRGGLRNEKGV